MHTLGVDNYCIHISFKLLFVITYCNYIACMEHLYTFIYFEIMYSICAAILMVMLACQRENVLFKTICS